MHTYKWMALETSTDLLSLAVASSHGDASQVWAHTSAGGAKSSQLVLPEIVQLMEDAHMRFEELTSVVFGKGPGSFTGFAHGVLRSARVGIWRRCTRLAYRYLVGGCRGCAVSKYAATATATATAANNTTNRKTSRRHAKVFCSYGCAHGSGLHRSL